MSTSNGSEESQNDATQQAQTNPEGEPRGTQVAQEGEILTLVPVLEPEAYLGEKL